MENDDLFWVERHAAALPYRPKAVDSAPKQLRALIDCGHHAQTSVWQLDWQQLAADERLWLESREDLPVLSFHWLDRAAALMRHCRLQKQTAALLEVPSRSLTQLSISDLMQVMGTDAWQDDGQVALVWGFAHDALMRPQAIHWPLPCRGAVYPCVDGLDIGWWASSADIAQIESPRLNV